jgi:hypothetical protein
VDWLCPEGANGGSSPSLLYEAGDSDSQVGLIDRPLPRQLRVNRVIFFAERATSAYPPTPAVTTPVRANALHLLVELRRTADLADRAAMSRSNHAKCKECCGNRGF